jgi:hypothetical protein
MTVNGEAAPGADAQENDRGQAGQQQRRASGREQVEAEDRFLGCRHRCHGRDLFHREGQCRHWELRGEPGVELSLHRWEPPNEAKPGQQQPGEPGEDGIFAISDWRLQIIGRHKGSGRVARFLPRLPETEERDEGDERDCGADDVDEPRAVVIADEELHGAESAAGDEAGGPHLEHSAPADLGSDEPERNNEREERQLAPHHRAEVEEIEPGERSRVVSGRPSPP